MKKIIVVDDPKTARTIEYDFGLRTQGARRTYEILIPEPGTELATIKAERPDMVIIDPALDNWQLVRQLRHDPDLVELLIITHGHPGKLADTDTVKSLLLDAQARKPYDFIQLATAIHLAFEHAGGI